MNAGPEAISGKGHIGGLEQKIRYLQDPLAGPNSSFDCLGSDIFALSKLEDILFSVHNLINSEDEQCSAYAFVDIFGETTFLQ